MEWLELVLETEALVWIAAIVFIGLIAIIIAVIRSPSTEDDKLLFALIRKLFRLR